MQIFKLLKNRDILSLTLTTSSSFYLEEKVELLNKQFSSIKMQYYIT